MIQRPKKITEIHSGYVQEQELQQKVLAKRKRGLYRRLTVFLTVFSFLAFFVVSTIATQLSTIDEQKQEEKQLQQELKAVRKEKAQLKDEVNKLNDVEYIGEILRRDFFMSKDGETIFKLPESKSD
ncbi:septum formation initiator family protein [Fictibacillus iocasae]|uniref:Septum formation initiator family protein n=1 Tax=Fictibacillus iocasae TaxID=2715437 RepID=A0ABW2NRG9_9BACL